MITISSVKESTTLHIEGRFSFELHSEFSEALAKALTREGKSIYLDFLKTEYLDSSALGMLLIARDKAAKVNKEIILTHAKDAVKAVLDIANFQKLFSII